MNVRGQLKRILGVVAVLVICLASAGLSTKSALASAADLTLELPILGGAVGGCTTVSPGTSACPQQGALNAATATQKDIIEPTLGVVLTGLLYNAITFVGDKLAYQTAAWLATGDKGQAPLFFSDSPATAWENFGLDTVANSLGTISQLYSSLGSSGTFAPAGNSAVVNGQTYTSGGAAAATFLSKFNLCAPPNPLAALSIAIGVKAAYAPPQPSCTFANVAANWTALVPSFLTSKDPTAAAMQALA